MFTAVVSILLFDFLFVKPYYSFSVGDSQYFIAFVGYVVIALIISSLATRLRHLLPQIWQSESELEATSGLSRGLVEAKTRQERKILKILADQMHNFGSGAFAILTPSLTGLQIGAGDYLTTRSTIKKKPLLNGLTITVRQRATEQIIFLQEEDTISCSKLTGRFLRIMAFAFEKPEETITPENKEIFETMALLGALALELM